MLLTTCETKHSFFSSEVLIYNLENSAQPFSTSAVGKGVGEAHWIVKKTFETRTGQCFCVVVRKTCSTKNFSAQKISFIYRICWKTVHNETEYSTLNSCKQNPKRWYINLCMFISSSLESLFQQPNKNQVMSTCIDWASKTGKADSQSVGIKSPLRQDSTTSDEL